MDKATRSRFRAAALSTDEGDFGAAASELRSIVLDTVPRDVRASALVRLGHLYKKLPDPSIRTLVESVLNSDLEDVANLALLYISEVDHENEEIIVRARDITSATTNPALAFAAGASAFHAYLRLESLEDASDVLNSLSPSSEADQIEKDIMESKLNRAVVLHLIQ